jgi:hypothetical protein
MDLGHLLEPELKLGESVQVQVEKSIPPEPWYEKALNFVQ